MASSTFTLVLGTGGLQQVGHLHQPQFKDLLKDHCKLPSTHPEDTWADVVRPLALLVQNLESSLAGVVAKMQWTQGYGGLAVGAAGELWAGEENKSLRGRGPASLVEA